MLRDEKTQQWALELKKELGSYLAISGIIGGSPALWWKVGEHGRYSPMARRLLGMPPLKTQTKPCPDCGQVHKLKHCNSDYVPGSRRRFACDIPDGADAERFRAYMRAARDAYKGE